MRSRAKSLLGFLLVSVSRVYQSSQRRGRVLSIVCATSKLTEEQFQVVDEDGKSLRNLSPTALRWAKIRNLASTVTRKTARREASGMGQATR